MSKNKGSLQPSHGTWYVVVSYKNEFGKPKTKWISTGIKVANNKTIAKARMKQILKELDIDNEINKSNEPDNDVYFVNFIKTFVEVKKQSVEPITYNAYLKEAEHISKYFANMRIKLKDLKPFHIEGFYKSLYDKGLSSNSVLHYHILIRECLQYAFKNDFVDVNVADKVDRPKTEGYKAKFYTIEEIEKLFDYIKDHECKLPIMLTAMYGFRRSEVVGLKWDAIDFEHKLIFIRHKVIETKLDGQRLIYKSDKMKTKTSNRALPLLPQAEELLRVQLKNIEKNKQELGSSYDERYNDYVCVDIFGRLILPSRLTHNFIMIIKKNNLKHIRFHDLRHSCASIMLKNGVPMKQIQEWLGHADFGTTANIYSHLDYTSKQNSANTISNLFQFVGNTNEQTDQQQTNSQSSQNNDNDEKEKLQKQIEELQAQLRRQQEDEAYQRWLLEVNQQHKKQTQIEDDGPEI